MSDHTGRNDATTECFGIDRMNLTSQMSLDKGTVCGEEMLTVKMTGNRSDCVTGAKVIHGDKNELVLVMTRSKVCECQLMSGK